MGSPITFSGFNNIDFSTVLNAEMAAASQPLVNLQASQSNVQSQIANFKQLGTYATTLQTAASALADASSVASSWGGWSERGLAAGCSPSLAGPGRIQK